MSERKEYYHVFDLCVGVTTSDPNPDNITEAQLIEALKARLHALCATPGEANEAFGHVDTECEF